MANFSSKPTMNDAIAESPKGIAPAADTFIPQRNLWVALRDAPSEYSHDEALLLCETFPGEWVSWVPGYGEITLSRGQFHQLAAE